jgi:transcriptional regulator with AAA-type ATPase domain
VHFLSRIKDRKRLNLRFADPSTIESLRAKNPRNLQNHVDRAIEQSRNKHIERIRVASANQLKSGDLSIKTSNRNEAEALKQFANDWISRIGRGTSIRLPTYGVLVHGIRTAKHLSKLRPINHGWDMISRKPIALPLLKTLPQFLDILILPV